MYCNDRYIYYNCSWSVVIADQFMCAEAKTGLQDDIRDPE